MEAQNIVSDHDAPTLEASNRGSQGSFRGRYRSGKPRDRGDSVSQQAAHAKVSSSSDFKPIAPVLNPQNLSKKQNPPENDSLWLKAFDIKGDRGLTEEAGDKKIAPTCASFISLSKYTYQQVAAADEEWAEFVSPAMYNYYNTVHLWSRIAAIRDVTGRTTEDEKNLLRYINNDEYPIHEPLNIFLRGFGDFVDPSGSKRKFVCLGLPSPDEFDGKTGFFGKVDAATHSLYENYPAPGVMASRIQEDYKHTLNKKLNRNWDLPKALRPGPIEVLKKREHNEDNNESASDEGSLHSVPSEISDEEESQENGDEADVIIKLKPTVNLLGWYPSNVLTKEQKQMIKQSGVTKEEFPADFPRFALNVALFEAIAVRMRQNSDKYKSGKAGIDNVKGSISQSLYIEREDKPEIFSRKKYYCDGSARACSACMVEASLSVAARVMTYRMRKEEIGGRRSWACYDFNEYRDVPDEWNDKRNMLFEYGWRIGTLNAGTKFTAYKEKDELRTPLIMQGLIKKN